MEKSSVGILDIIGVILIELKLCKVISVSWLWVLAPFWIQFILLVVIGGLIGTKIKKEFRDNE